MRAGLALEGLTFLALLAVVEAGRAGSPVVATLDGHGGSICCTAFSPDGKLLAIGGGTGKRSGYVKLWDASTHQLSGTLGGHTGLVHALAFAPDGKTLATAGNDGTARIWDVRWRRERMVIKGDGGALRGVAFMPDGKTLATGVERGPPSVKLWEVVTGKERASLPAGAGMPLAFIDRGKQLVTVSASRMQVGGVTLRRQGLGFAVDNWGYAVAISPDGKLLAEGSDSAGGWVWETETGKPRFGFPPDPQNC